MYKKSTILSKQDKYFIDEYLKTKNATKSIRTAIDKAGGDSTNLSEHYLRTKGHRLMTKEHILNTIEQRKQIMNASATLAAQRLQTIITDGKDADAINAGKFVIEQVDGRATQLTEVKSTAITLNIDLSGGALEQGTTDYLTDKNPTPTNSDAQ